MAKRTWLMMFAPVFQSGCKSRVRYGYFVEMRVKTMKPFRRLSAFAEQESLFGGDTLITLASKRR